MNEYHEANLPSLVIHLNELKSLFDEKIQHGECFEEVKKIYNEIKELESKLNVINWQAQRS
jgi:hypothetical protein